MQIHELNNFNGQLGGGSFLAVDDGNDTGKITTDQLLENTETEIRNLGDSLNARIDNIIGGGEAPSAAEVSDARLGADGVTYPSLGAAIRGQVSDLTIDINEANKGTFSFPVSDYVRGQIDNGNDGTYYQNRIKLANIHNSGDRYLHFISTDSGYSIRFTLYDGNGVYQSQTGFIQNYVIGPDTNYRLNIRRDADTEADHSTAADISLLSTKLVAETILMDGLNDAYKGKLKNTLLDFPMESGIIDSSGNNNDGEYNLPRKMRTVSYVFGKAGDVVSVSNSSLRFIVFNYGMNKVYKNNSGWQTTDYIIPEDGYIRFQFGLTGDYILADNLKLTYRAAISINNNVTDVVENIRKDMFAINGTDRAYNYEGEKIDVNKYGYDIEELWNFSNPTTQGTYVKEASAYNNGVVFKCYHTDLMQLYDFSDGSKIAEFPITCGHGNSIDFSNEYYNSSDEFPLAYISSDQTPAEVYVNRITLSGATLIRTLTFPAARTGYYANHCLDNVNNVLYMMGYKNEDYQTPADGNHMIVTKWDLSNLTDNGDGSFTPEYIDEFTLPFIDTTQGRAFLNGKMFVMSSNPYVPSDGRYTKVYVIDVGGQRISNILSGWWYRIRDNEGEGLFFVPNGDKYDLILDIQIKGLYRITF